MPESFPAYQGLVATPDGGVWIGAAPWLLFVPDRDHDLVPDGEPEVLLDGWGWKPLYDELDYQAVDARVMKEVFGDESS